MARVVDDFGLIDGTGRAGLLERLRALETQVDAELIVMAVPSVAKRAFREHAVASRRIVSSQRDRSILLVVATGDRHVEIATARRFAARFGGGESTRLLQETAVPLLRADDLAGALEAGMTAIAERLRGWVPEPEPAGVGISEGTPRLAIAAIAGALLLLVVFATCHHGAHRSGDGGYYGSDSSSFDSSDSGSSSGSDSGSSDSGSSDGGGGADY